MHIEWGRNKNVGSQSWGVRERNRLRITLEDCCKAEKPTHQNIEEWWNNETERNI